jgi:sugar phosphate isomerase/epimerase
LLKLTFITDEATQEPAEFIRLAEQHGVDAIELRTVYDRHCSDLSRDERAALKGQLDAAGLAVCCIDSSVFKIDLVDDLTIEYAKLERALKAAHDFGAPYVRIFSFWRGCDCPFRMQRVNQAVARAADIAAKAGKTLLVENGKRTTHATGADLAALMQQVSHEALCVLWDPANSVLGGTDVDPLGYGFKLARPHTRHVHLKQVHRHPVEDKLCYGPLRDGTLNIDRFISQLVASRYNDYVSVETHWRPGKWFTEHELDHPGGQDFSADGWQVTSEALQFLSQRVHALA